MKSLTLVLVAAMLFCGCNRSTQPTPPEPTPAPVAPAEIEMQVIAVPPPGSGIDPIEDGRILVEGKMMSWSDLDAYVQARAVDAPHRPDPAVGLATPVVIRSGQDTPVKLMQFATLLCIRHYFAYVYWGLNGSLERFNVVASDLVPGKGSFPDPMKFFIAVSCRMEKGNAVWLVNNQKVATEEEILGKLMESAASFGNAKEIYVSVDGDAEMLLHHFFTVFEAASRAGISDHLLVAPPRAPIPSWPKAVRESLERAGLLPRK